ncbi:hypothetical protein K504DRAFT_462209 [Pleomassaria siparia CBS 279.74]|uniref:Uncharacterized protein n=1 Tax=Pleomassaria siparia CBS 279.74 TaxID=1314801 RepID=A0A6G1KLI7_9PLEO|nr:hypothetical protein K504DRAFT_462209 [Pleomassaria siparia CBS 279.74]
MDSARRLDVLDLDLGVPDEELPDYEPQTAPDYEIAYYETPLLRYYLRQINRKLQVFVPYGPSVSLSSYKVISNTFRIFSKKPEIEVIHVVLLNDGQATRAEKSVASIGFDNSGPLPWRPRARVCHFDSHGQSTHAMESKNFKDWTIVIGENTYMWALEGNAVVQLVMKERGSAVTIARFIYSSMGTSAINGAEVGELTVYGDGGRMDEDGIEKVICGLMVSITHFKKMGRHYSNDEPVRAAS